MQQQMQLKVQDRFHDKLALVMKALSLTRAKVAVELRVDKSLVGRWATGKATPSAHNMARLTALVATRSGKFSMLDWERDLTGIARLLGVEPGLLEVEPAPAGLDGPLASLSGEIQSTTARRGPAYEGFFRNTRPNSDIPGLFLHDYVMNRMEPDGLHSYTRCIGNIFVEARMLALHSQLFVIGVETLSRLPIFCIINGVNGSKAMRYEALMLYAALDISHTPYASPVVSERIADLHGDRDADDAYFAELGKQAGLAPEGSVSPELAAHLTRDVGPQAHAAGGDLMLSLPLVRSMAKVMMPA